PSISTKNAKPPLTLAPNTMMFCSSAENQATMGYILRKLKDEQVPTTSMNEDNTIKIGLSKIIPSINQHI
ncbi:hypothetical protein HispidOSU_025974, partial [Sigmodon hispidus]